ncbi:hypothetical protein F4782DRAFT_533578 [Xylaria castorea]|nr:hypothetical protein F4782DRAFT_533578 [Xylaria castorea]
MWSMLAGYMLLERRREAETTREDDDDGSSSHLSDSTNAPILTPSSTSSPPDPVLSPPPSAMLAPARSTIFRYAPGGLTHRERHRDTAEDSREESHQPRLGRRLGSRPGATVPRPGFSPRHGGGAENIIPERGCVPGNNWPRGRVERPSTPPSLLPLTARHRLPGWLGSDSSDSPARRPKHHRSSEPRPTVFPEPPKQTITPGRDSRTTITVTKNEPLPRKPETEIEPARPKYTHGLAMARAAGHQRIVGPHRTPLLPRGPPRSDGRDARASKWAAPIPLWRQQYPELN